MLRIYGTSVPPLGRVIKKIFMKRFVSGEYQLPSSSIMDICTGYMTTQDIGGLRARLEPMIRKGIQRGYYNSTDLIPIIKTYANLGYPESAQQLYQFYKKIRGISFSSSSSSSYCDPENFLLPPPPKSLFMSMLQSFGYVGDEIQVDQFVKEEVLTIECIRYAWRRHIIGLYHRNQENLSIRSKEGVGNSLSPSDVNLESLLLLFSKEMIKYGIEEKAPFELIWRSFLHGWRDGMMERSSSQVNERMNTLLHQNNNDHDNNEMSVLGNNQENGMMMMMMNDMRMVDMGGVMIPYSVDKMIREWWEIEKQIVEKVKLELMEEMKRTGTLTMSLKL